MAKTFPAVLVTGPRQVGKTTVLKTMLKDSVRYVTLDNRQSLLTARERQELFFKEFYPPVIVDEIQYAPNLFSEIKQIADTEQKRGEFFMTGSQAFHLMKNVSESLAGRVGVINMQGLSLREVNGDDCDKPFLPTEEFLRNRSINKEADSYWHIWNMIVRGGMPLMQDKSVSATDFYTSYLSTYISRDVKDLTQVSDELQFLKFLTVAAAHTGNLVNYENIANEVGVSLSTVKRWMSILVTSGIVYILEPYFNNILNRAVKTPKLYFMDTGLVCHLTRWYTEEQAQNGAMSGALLETFVVSEIIKSYYNAGISRPPIYFYRDKDKNEIDLIIEENGTLYPIEIKKTGHANSGDISAFKKLDEIVGYKRGSGAVVSFADDLRYLDEKNYIVPMRFL
ncbi:MAG: ATP-binding protein [Clostridiales bacterium]|jgi:predicted AAA+ superfamily ATPase|nr:ATP-binding protein [Clostridiales bacterium]